MITNKFDFVKMHACGNDFIIIDMLNFNEKLPHKKKQELAKLCHRNLGIGCDDLLLIQHSKIADAKMRVIEPDGSEANMCGNGIRCVARYLIERTNFSSPLTIETKAGIKTVYLENGKFKVLIGDHKIIASNQIADETDHSLFFINTGEPHIISFITCIADNNIMSRVNTLRSKFEFLNIRCNVNFVEIISMNHLKIRTYERGVENETLSCGTGATASALAAVKYYNLVSPITVETRGGNLSISIISNKVYLEGPAEFVFDGFFPKNKNYCKCPPSENPLMLRTKSISKNSSERI